MNVALYDDILDAVNFGFSFEEEGDSVTMEDIETILPSDFVLSIRLGFGFLL
jgi:hypothetical protein